LLGAEKNAPNGIFSLNAYSSYSNPRLFKLLRFTKANPRLNYTEMLMFFPNKDLIYKNDLLSMLGVKYIVDSDGYISNKITNNILEPLISWQNISFPIKNDKEFLVFSEGVKIKSNTTYEVRLNFENVDENNYIYLDIFSEDGKLDDSKHDTHISLANGKLYYREFIYTGDISHTKDFPIYFRVIAKTVSPMILNNLELNEVELNEAILPSYSIYSPAKHLDLSESISQDYPLYVNENSRSILHKPDNVVSIDNVADIYANVLNYNFFNSYIKDFKTIELGNVNTEISNINFKINSITADVYSDKPTFINFSQNYFNGWKAKVNSKKVPVYMVNGVIMGIEVPAGDNKIEFYYKPIPVYIALVISFITLVLLSFCLLKNIKRKC
jgi:hypothetical protein